MNVIARFYKDEDLDAVNLALGEGMNKHKCNFNYEGCYEVVGCVDNVVVGYLLLTRVYNPVEDKLYFIIDDVCVYSKYRGLGVSDKMMDFAYEIAKKNKARYIQLEGRPFRVAAHKLYERCGYEQYHTDVFRKAIL